MIFGDLIGSDRRKRRPELEVRTHHAAVPEPTSVYRRGEVQAPLVLVPRVLPVDETLRGLGDPRACQNKKQNNTLGKP